MDSLESKLNQLKNAWDTFIMGIMDSTLLKAGIDLLTGLMTAINSIIELFDKLHLGGVASIGLIVAALYLGAKAIDVFSASLRSSGSILTAFGSIGKTAAKSVSQGISKTTLTLKNMQKTLEQNRRSMKMFGKVKMRVDTTDATKALNNYKKATTE
jgi:hypothetical protein